MLNFLLMLNAGLRMATALAAAMNTALYARYYALYLRTLIKREFCLPALRNAAAYVVLAAGLLGFMGKRVTWAVVYDLSLDFDHSIGGLEWSCACLFTAKLQDMGYPKTATYIRLAKIAVSVDFALFYGVAHGIV